jgi:heme ABC exporter ATP-binding subunit CcmA
MTARTLAIDERPESVEDASTPAPIPLALDQVERRWGKQPVLRGATLTLTPGTIAWLGGPNGAGKTTLLRVAAGLITPHAGSVKLYGLDPEHDRKAYQERLGYLSAGDRGLYARLTVAQNLDFWSGIALVPLDRKAELIDAALERFALHELANRRVDRISMGQRQRVRLSMVFLHEPDVIMLDEPHTSLDSDALELLELALSRHSERGGAVLWCSPAAEHLPLRADVRYALADGIIGPL